MPAQQQRPAAGRPAEPSAPIINEASEMTPLSEAEREVMNKLLTRASQVQTPSTRPGDPYIALINLNVPRRGVDPLRGSDLVMAGETVNLTPEEAAGYMRHGPNDGRRVPVIRPATGPKSTSEAPQRVPPRAVSGALRQPAAPPPGSGMPLPDPAGSSAILQQEAVPEAQDPVPGSENWDGDPGAGGGYVSAQDIIPERTRARAAAAAQRGG
jgi:hypothetical protein